VESLGFHIPSLIIYLVNFGILLGLLYLFAYKPILRMMDQRADRIRESLEAADTARQEAARSQADTQAQLNEARLQGQRLLDQAREMAERYRADEQERARQEAETFVSRAREDIQRERDAAIQEVRSHFADLAITAAERVIQRSLDRSAHGQLIASVLEEGDNLGATGGPRGPIGR
jgi:F-type H+-transporting ATPase subunit b